VSEDDWLTEPALDYPVAKPDEGAPADAQLPGLSEQSVAAAIEAKERKAQFIVAWDSLSDSQRVFLNTWRECRFNTNRTLRVLAGTQHGYSKTSVQRWVESPGYALCRETLRGASISEILSRDYLAARHEDIVETAMTPTPILHQGVATGHFEVELGVAQKANETLLKLGGHLKEEKQDLNVGIVGPNFTIQVVQPDNTLKTIQAAGVPIELPKPAEDDNWLDDGA
jgi:hypothetical protein